jgi:XXXCH domain-containing protein
MGKKETKFKAIMNREQLLCHLDGLVAGVRAGSIAVEGEKGKTTLPLTEKTSVKMEAAQKKDKYKLELEMSWSREAGEEAPAGDAVDQESEGDDDSGDYESGGDDQEETEGEPQKTSYKKLKKTMQKEVKALQAELKRGVMPTLERIESFTRNCREMTSVPGRGDEYYPRFNEQVQVLALAAEAGNTADYAAALEVLLEMKAECNSKFK